MTKNLAPQHRLRLITIPDRAAGSGTRVRVGSPAAILAVVPYLLGFLPESSLVVIGVEPPGGTIKVTMRYDLPDPADADLAADIAAHAFGVIGAQDLTAAAAIGYGPDALVAPLAAAFGQLDEAADLIDFLRVDDGRYWSYNCADPACCPPGGTAFDLAGYPVPAALAGDGARLLASRDNLVDSIAPLNGIVAESMRQATRRAEQHVTQLLAKVRKSARLGAARHMIATEGLSAVSQMISTYRAGGRFATDYQVAWLTVALKDLRVRDDAWARMDPRYEEAHRKLWTDVVRRAQPGHVAAPASLLAFVAWQAGNGVLANVALDRALADDPGYSMATLLRQVISAGAPPSMARVPMTPEEVAEAYDDREREPCSSLAPGLI
jgi:transposase